MVFRCKCTIWAECRTVHAIRFDHQLLKAPQPTELTERSHKESHARSTTVMIAVRVARQCLIADVRDGVGMWVRRWTSREGAACTRHIAMVRVSRNDVRESRYERRQYCSLTSSSHTLPTRQTTDRISARIAAAAAVGEGAAAALPRSPFSVPFE